MMHFGYLTLRMLVLFLGEMIVLMKCEARYCEFFREEVGEEEEEEANVCWILSNNN